MIDICKAPRWMGNALEGLDGGTFNVRAEGFKMHVGIGSAVTACRVISARGSDWL